MDITFLVRRKKPEEIMNGSLSVLWVLTVALIFNESDFNQCCTEKFLGKVKWDITNSAWGYDYI